MTQPGTVILVRHMDGSKELLQSKREWSTIHRELYRITQIEGVNYVLFNGLGSLVHCWRKGHTVKSFG